MLATIRVRAASGDSGVAHRHRRDSQGRLARCVELPHWPLSRVLVVFEIALSCALLVAAGLMIKSVTKMQNIDAGFITKNVFTARVGFPTTYTDTVLSGSSSSSWTLA